MKLPFKGIKPTKKHKADAGLDLRAKEAAHWGGPFQMRTIDTGTAVDIPEGCVGILAARSSLSKRGLMLANGVGIIDAGYHGTIKVPLVSFRGGCTVSEGERIAQLLVINIKNSKPVKVEAFEESERGEGGFGSTGRN